MGSFTLHKGMRAPTRIGRRRCGAERRAVSTTPCVGDTLDCVPRIALLALLLLAACARPPKPLAGEFPDTGIAEARIGAQMGEQVRWGGTIVRTTPQAEQTCFEIVSRPLDRRARPEATDESGGRFVACATGFYDPEVYAPKREVTIVGTLDGSTTGKVGGYEYVYPRIEAQTVYLWPERVHYEGYYAPYLYPMPYVGPWYPWYPYWWGAYATFPIGHPHGHH